MAIHVAIFAVKISFHAHTDSRVRLVTLDMTILLLKKMVMRNDNDGHAKSILSDYHLASIEQAKEEAALLLRNFYKSEEEAIFLDLFEEEYFEMSKRRLNVEYLMMDANLLLPPSQLTSLMMNGLEYTRRLPCADVERTRYVSSRAKNGTSQVHSKYSKCRFDRTLCSYSFCSFRRHKVIYRVFAARK